MMKTAFIHCVVVTVLLICALNSVAWSETQNISLQLNNYMEQKVKENHFNGAVLVSKGGKVLLSKAYGWANLEHKVPNTTKTKFRIGSVSKQFTAMTIMILQEKGKLTVYDPVKIHIPDIPDSWSEITIHQMLSHTSGLADMMVLADWKQKVTRPAPLESTIGWFNGKKGDSPECQQNRNSA